MTRGSRDARGRRANLRRRAAAVGDRENRGHQLLFAGRGPRRSTLCIQNRRRKRIAVSGRRDAQALPRRHRRRRRIDYAEAGLEPLRAAVSARPRRRVPDERGSLDCAAAGRAESAGRGPDFGDRRAADSDRFDHAAGKPRHRAQDAQLPDRFRIAAQPERTSGRLPAVSARDPRRRARRIADARGAARAQSLRRRLRRRTGRDRRHPARREAWPAAIWKKRCR